MFQVRVDGCTFNRLEPYPGWHAFSSEAKEMWTGYLKDVRLRQLKRLALRYLNRYNIPGARVDLKDFFRTGPELSSDLPQVLDGFFMQSRVSLPEASSIVIINQTIVPPVVPDHQSFILDIELVRTEGLPEGDDIWPILENMRAWKNKVFEACITDRIREMIQ
jgi:uncharacterized protein (TIGR04255 family)